MSNPIDPIGVMTPGYENNTSTKPAGESNSKFSNVLNGALNNQIQQSIATSMPGLGGTGGFPGFGGVGMPGGIGGADAMFGNFIPSASIGMENALMATANSGEMSGMQLMLFMMIMMMQSGDGGGDMTPIIQMLAHMLSQSNDNSKRNPNIIDPSSLRFDPSDVMQADNTDPSIRRMVEIALSQVGYHERNRDGSIGNGNMTQFGAWYGMDGQPWCAMFVSWAANQAGLLHDTVPKHASTSKGVAAYQERGLYAPRNSGYMPREGDAVYFTNSSGRIGHVGIVVAVDPETRRVYTVEGNTSNAVRVRHYDLNNSRIHGYGKNGGTGNGTIPLNSTSGTGASTV